MLTAKFLTRVILFSICLYTVGGHRRLNLHSKSWKYHLTGKSINLQPDPKLKQGIIRWVKDIADLNLVETWYNMKSTERACVTSGMEFASHKTRFKEFNAKALDDYKYYLDAYVDYFCPKAWKKVDKLYVSVKKYEKLFVDYYESLPDVIKEPLEKIRKLNYTKDLNDDEQKRIFVKSIEEIFNLNEGQLNLLQLTHPALFTFLTGDIRNASLNLMEILRQNYDESSFGELIAEKERLRRKIVAVKKLLFAIQTELINYFTSQNYYTPNITEYMDVPRHIEHQFTRDMEKIYDDIYKAYDKLFSLIEMYAAVDQSEQNNSSKSNKLNGFVYLIMAFVIFNVKKLFD